MVFGIQQMSHQDWVIPLFPKCFYLAWKGVFCVPGGVTLPQEPVAHPLWPLVETSSLVCSLPLVDTPPEANIVIWVVLFLCAFFPLLCCIPFSSLTLSLSFSLVVMMFLYSCVFPLGGTPKLVPHSVSFAMPWSQDPGRRTLLLGSLCSAHSWLGLAAVGFTWCPAGKLLLGWCVLISVCMISKRLLGRMWWTPQIDCLGYPNLELSGLFLCQKWWIVFVDFEQLANRSAPV